MKYSATLALASLAIGVSAQGVPTGIAPAGGSPPGCMTTVSGKYEVQNVKAMSKRSLEKRVVDCSSPSALVVQINNGVMTDSAGRIAEIVANRQFQFDGPPAQVGSIYTGGWSMCSNGSLAIGPSTVFYQCLSGSFYNIYDQPVGAGCMEIHQQLLQCADSSTGSTTASASASASASSTTASVASSQPDGQPTVGSAQSTISSVVSQATDGQPQATSAGVSQISDGQPQATSPSNTTVTTKAPIPTGGATQYAASGAVAVLGAVAAFFL